MKVLCAFSGAAYASKTTWHMPDTGPPQRVDYAPGARKTGSVEVLLARQLRDLIKNPIPGISVAPDDDDMRKWHVKVDLRLPGSNCLRLMHTHQSAVHTEKHANMTS